MNECASKNRFRATVRPDGRLDMDTLGEFRNACRHAIDDAEVSELVVDFSKMSHIDSMALGALIALRERAIKASKQISLVNCNWRIRRVFGLANLDRLFAISS